MRTHKIGETTIEYPDEISFCFNPVVINIYGHAWDYVEVTLPSFVSENVLNYLVENFQISPTSTPEEDLKKILEK